MTFGICFEIPIVVTYQSIVLCKNGQYSKTEFIKVITSTFSALVLPFCLFAFSEEHKVFVCAYVFKAGFYELSGFINGFCRGMSGTHRF
jgi:hypothetical protein